MNHTMHQITRRARAFRWLEAKGTALWENDPVNGEVSLWWDGEKFACCVRKTATYTYTGETLLVAVEAAMEVSA
jgi:hypothetical protein